MPVKGWSMYETVAVGIVNPKAVSKMTNVTQRAVILRKVLKDGHPSKAEAVAQHEQPGVASVYVVYTDYVSDGPDHHLPGGGKTPLKLPLGEWKEGGFACPSEDWRENLTEVERSYAEEWANFLTEMPDAVLVASVMES